MDHDMPRLIYASLLIAALTHPASSSDTFRLEIEQSVVLTSTAPVDNLFAEPPPGVVFLPRSGHEPRTTAVIPVSISHIAAGQTIDVEGPPTTTLSMSADRRRATVIWIGAVPGAHSIRLQIVAEDGSVLTSENHAFMLRPDLSITTTSHQALLASTISRGRS